MALGLLVGVVLAVLGPRLLDLDLGDDADTSAIDAIRPTPDEPVDRPDADEDPAPPGAGAESAEAALTGFLDAEVEQNFERSFGFLSAADRRSFGSSAGWIAAHADVLAPVLDYEVEEVSAGEEGTTVVTTVTFEPGLDQVVGLTPGQATVTWQVLPGPDGDWGVSLETSTVEPEYPPDEGAAVAARQWVDARQACATPPSERSDLIGSPGLAENLCGAAGSFDLGEVAPLTEIETTPVATAFGPEAAVASRVVRVSGAVELGLVLTPIGDDWIVIGVVR